MMYNLKAVISTRSGVLRMVIDYLQGFMSHPVGTASHDFAV